MSTTTFEPATDTNISPQRCALMEDYQSRLTPLLAEKLASCHEVVASLPMLFPNPQEADRFREHCLKGHFRAVVISVFGMTQQSSRKLAPEPCCRVNAAIRLALALNALWRIALDTIIFILSGKRPESHLLERYLFDRARDLGIDDELICLQDPFARHTGENHDAVQVVESSLLRYFEILQHRDLSADRAGQSVHPCLFVTVGSDYQQLPVWVESQLLSRSNIDKVRRTKVVDELSDVRGILCVPSPRAVHSNGTARVGAKIQYAIELLRIGERWLESLPAPQDRAEVFSVVKQVAQDLVAFGEECETLTHTPVRRQTNRIGSNLMRAHEVLMSLVDEVERDPESVKSRTNELKKKVRKPMEWVRRALNSEPWSLGLRRGRPR